MNTSIIPLSAQILLVGMGVIILFFTARVIYKRYDDTIASIFVIAIVAFILSGLMNLFFAPITFGLLNLNTHDAILVSSGIPVLVLVIATCLSMAKHAK